MTEVMRYFDMKAGEFRTKWSKMTETDKVQLKSGTLTY